MTPSVVEQHYELVAIDSLRMHPDNPRRGIVDQIRESVQFNGFFGAVIVQRSTSYILVGNHRWLAAREAGMSEIPVLFADVDDEAARRIMLADNRFAELAVWDDDSLLELLDQLALSDDALAGTGFTDADLAALSGADDFEPDDAEQAKLDERKPHTCPQCGFSWRILSDGTTQAA